MPSSRILANVARVLRRLPPRIEPGVRWRIERRLLRAPRFTAALRATRREEGELGAFWEEYALTSLLRGRQNVRLVERVRPVAGARVLDVGAAYGGTPIAFARAGAREVVGIEYDESLWKLSQSLARDFPSNARLLQGSALDAAFLAPLGRFDVVTCMDVIEHVADPMLLLERLADVLADDGVLLLKIPNKDAVSFVRADGHYGLFGLTLLPPAEAREVYEALGPPEPYSVGEYLPLEAYRQALARRGLDATLLRDFVPHPGDVEWIRAEAARLRADVPRLLAHPKATDRTRALLAEAAHRYLDEIDRALAAYDRLGRSAPLSDLVEQLVDRYETEFWKLVVRRRR